MSQNHSQDQINTAFPHLNRNTEDRSQLPRHFQQELKYRFPDLQFINLDKKIIVNMCIISMNKLEKTNLKLHIQDSLSLQTENNGLHVKYSNNRNLHINILLIMRSIICINIYPNEEEKMKQAKGP